VENQWSVAKDRQIGKRTASAALRHLSAEISSMVPWISTKSSDWLCRSTVSPRIAFTSESLFLFPVMKLSCLGAMLALVELIKVRLAHTAFCARYSEFDSAVNRTYNLIVSTNCSLFG
jgi:hypothetical protein